MEWNTGDERFRLILLKRRHKNERLNNFTWFPVSILHRMNRVIIVRKINRFIKNPNPKEKAERTSYF